MVMPPVLGAGKDAGGCTAVARGVTCPGTVALPAVSDAREFRLRIAKGLVALGPAVPSLGRLFAAAGHEISLVGGVVRDMALGRGSYDLDLTTDADPDETERLLAGWADATWDIGKAFGTIGARKGDETFEVTTYRAEAYDRASRKPAVVYGTDLVDDLRRRDFTVNAMAIGFAGDGDQPEFVDPFDGLADLAAGVLRTPASPAESFGDDPLRMMRAARFAAQLQFTLDPAARGRDDRPWPTGCPSCRWSGCRRSCRSCCCRRRRVEGWRCSSRPASPRRCCRSCRCCSWRPTSTTGTRTSTSIR